MQRAFLVLFASLTLTSLSYAQSRRTTPTRRSEDVTIVFKTGHQVTIPSGYDKIAREMKRIKGKDSNNLPFELIINGSPFLLNLADVSAVCKGRCTYLSMVDRRDPARAPSK